MFKGVEGRLQGDLNNWDILEGTVFRISNKQGRPIVGLPPRN
jgi:hypothetical protein